MYPFENRTKANSKTAYSNLSGRFQSEYVFKDCQICGWMATSAESSLEYIANGIKILKEKAKKENRDRIYCTDVSRSK